VLNTYAYNDAAGTFTVDSGNLPVDNVNGWTVETL
jgi:hypothetical protein